MVNGHKMTVGQVFERFRQMPEMREFVEQCYLDEDLLEAARRFHNGEEFSAVLEYVSHEGIRPPGLILDLGGGNGVASLAWKWGGYQVILVEPDDNHIVGLGAIMPLLKKTKHPIGACAAIGERLPFPTGAFSIVYTRQVLHHISDLNAVCVEAYRLLRKKGLFVATREHVITEQTDLDEFLRKHPIHPYTGGENARLFSEYYDALKRAGFRRIKVLGPWESVINYYPMSKSQLGKQCYHALCNRLGVKMGSYLATRRNIQKWCGWYWTIRDHTPGRLYSFLATR